MNQTLDELQISELWAASILPSVSKLQKQQGASILIHFL